MSKEVILKDTPNVTSSSVSQDGLMPSNSQVGLQLDLFGPGHAPVNRFQAQVKDKVKKTRDTSGLNSHGLSPSAILQLSLENRLRQKMDVNGSLEYELTWKQWVMQSGLPICALRASARHTSGKGCTGWGTPSAADSQGSNGGGQVKSLRTDASVAGWPTAKVSTGDYQYGQDGEKILNLSGVAQVAGWATPTGQDAKNNAGQSEFKWNSDPLNVLAVKASGQTQSSSPAGMEKRGVLNPDLARWLMGYPEEWGFCGATGIASCLRRRKHS